MGRDSLVGIASRYGMGGPGIESRERRGGQIFRSRPHRTWGPSSPLCNGYRFYFPGVMRPGRGVNHSPPSTAEIKERIELCLYSLLGLHGPVLG